MEECQERIFKVGFKLIICIRFVRFWFKLLNTSHHRPRSFVRKILKFCEDYISEDWPEADGDNNVLAYTLVILFVIFWILLIFGLSYCNDNQMTCESTIMTRCESSISSSSPPSSPPPPLLVNQLVNQPAMPPPPPPMAGATIQSYEDLPPPPAYEETLFPLWFLINKINL